MDCGVCVSCGDRTCQPTESCSTCPADCGTCERCENGFCVAPEDCFTCPADCGSCDTCGDGTCSASSGETCFSCPDDCGRCMGCGDGMCRSTEDCASCSADCGTCAFCGNMVCEPPFESVSNCEEDCGRCDLGTCFEGLTCVIGCLGGLGGGGTPDIFCATDCINCTCPDARFFLMQALDCAIPAAFEEDCRDLACFQRECGPEFLACIGDRRTC